MKANKLTVIAAEFPYPPLHGAKVDVWRRLCALHRVGAKIQLVCWVHQQPDDAALAQVRTVVNDVIILLYPSGIVGRLLQLILLSWYPLQLTSRYLWPWQMPGLLQQIKKFDPSIVWIDGLHGTPLGVKLHKALQSKPILLYRSHNIEYLYHKRLLMAAVGIKRNIYAFLCLWGVERIERKILKKVKFFFDISLHDLEFWKKQGFENGKHLPPLLDFEQLSNERLSQNGGELLPTPHDFVFLGNLRTENNVSGLVWLVEEVWPLVRNANPKAKLTIAGSQPIDRILKFANEETKIQVLRNPESANAVYAAGKVLLNPVYLGSGVSVKSIEMLQFGKPIITRSQGLSGLPSHITRDFIVADDPAEFAEKMLESLQSPKRPSVTDFELREQFGDHQIQLLLEGIDFATRN